MAKTITELTAAGAVDGANDLIWLEQSGLPYKITPDDLAAGQTPLVLTDIVTASPPTTEAVTGAYEIRDADNDDDLMSLGYEGSNTLYLRNKMHGGLFQITVEDSGSTVRTAVAGGTTWTAMYHTGVRKILTQTHGIDIQGSVLAANPPTTEAVDTKLRLYDQDLSTQLMSLGFEGNNTLRLKNLMEGGNFELTHVDAGGTPVYLINADPDSGVSLYFQGSPSIGTRSNGMWVYGDGPATSPPTTWTGVNEINLIDSDATDTLANVGFNGSNLLRFINRMRGGSVYIAGADTSTGDLKACLIGDPDGTTVLHYAGIARAAVEADGAFDVRSDTSTDAETKGVTFSHASGVRRGICGIFGGTIMYLRNEIHGGSVYIDAERTSDGAVSNMIRGDADANLDFYYPLTNDLRMRMAAGGIVNVYSDDSTDTENRQINLCHANANVRGILGYKGSDILYIENQVHGGSIFIEGEHTTAGAQSIFLAGDPDGITTLRARTNIQLQNNNGEKVLYGIANGQVEVYFNDVLEMQTQYHLTSGQTSGLSLAHRDTNFYDVGFNQLPDFGWNTTPETLEGSHCGAITGYNYVASEASADLVLTLAASDDEDFPVDGVTTIINGDDTWNVQIVEGTGVTLYVLVAGTGLVDSTGSCDIGPGGLATLRRESTTVYHIMGSEITYP